MAEKMYFLAMSIVFRSTTSVSNWETFQRAIEALIILISKHKHLLEMLKWEDEDIYIGELVQAVECPLNPGVPDLNGSLEAYTYVDDILVSAVNKHNILRLLAATIKAIFTVCNYPNIEVLQCSLSLAKGEELVVGLVQTVLGLIVDTNRFTVEITSGYLGQVRELLVLNWPSS
jgi:hypothetical protein